MSDEDSGACDNSEDIECIDPLLFFEQMSSRLSALQSNASMLKITMELHSQHFPHCSAAAQAEAQVLMSKLEERLGAHIELQNLGVDLKMQELLHQLMWLGGHNATAHRLAGTSQLAWRLVACSVVENKKVCMHPLLCHDVITSIVVAITKLKKTI